MSHEKNMTEYVLKIFITNYIIYLLYGIYIYYKYYITLMRLYIIYYISLKKIISTISVIFNPLFFIILDSSIYIYINVNIKFIFIYLYCIYHDIIDINFQIHFNRISTLL